MATFNYRITKVRLLIGSSSALKFDLSTYAPRTIRPSDPNNSTHPIMLAPIIHLETSDDRHLFIQRFNKDENEQQFVYALKFGKIANRYDYIYYEDVSASELPFLTREEYLRVINELGLMFSDALLESDLIQTPFTGSTYQLIINEHNAIYGYHYGSDQPVYGARLPGVIIGGNARRNDKFRWFHDNVYTDYLETVYRLYDASNITGGKNQGLINMLGFIDSTGGHRMNDEKTAVLLTIRYFGSITEKGNVYPVLRNLDTVTSQLNIVDNGRGGKKLHQSDNSRTIANGMIINYHYARVGSVGFYVKKVSSHRFTYGDAECLHPIINERTHYDNVERMRHQLTKEEFNPRRFAMVSTYPSRQYVQHKLPFRFGKWYPDYKYSSDSNVVNRDFTSHLINLPVGDDNLEFDMAAITTKTLTELKDRFSVRTYLDHVNRVSNTLRYTNDLSTSMTLFSTKLIPHMYRSSGVMVDGNFINGVPRSPLATFLSIFGTSEYSIRNGLATGRSAAFKTWFSTIVQNHYRFTTDGGKAIVNPLTDIFKVGDTASSVYAHAYYWFPKLKKVNNQTTSFTVGDINRLNQPNNRGHRSFSQTISEFNGLVQIDASTYGRLLPTLLESRYPYLNESTIDANDLGAPVFPIPLNAPRYLDIEIPSGSYSTYDMTGRALSLFHIQDTNIKCLQVTISSPITIYVGKGSDIPLDSGLLRLVSFAENVRDVMVIFRFSGAGRIRIIHEFDIEYMRDRYVDTPNRFMDSVSIDPLYPVIVGKYNSGISIRTDVTNVKGNFIFYTSDTPRAIRNRIFVEPIRSNIKGIGTPDNELIEPAETKRRPGSWFDEQQISIVS